MAFKTMEDYNEERYRGMFLLRNDKDYADVVIMYRSMKDVLIADTHYIKSDKYTGYVHCCGRGCPACRKGIRVQNKLFIPLYNIAEGKVQFFDRSTRFENVLMNTVFSKFANPSEYVFRITRHGESGSLDTTYDISAVGKNLDPELSYEGILKKLNISLPEYYNEVCRDMLPSELDLMLNTSDDSESDSLPDYSVTPRGGSVASAGAADIPATPPVVPSPVDASSPEAGSADVSSDTAIAPDELDEDVKF